MSPISSSIQSRQGIFRVWAILALSAFPAIALAAKFDDNDFLIAAETSNNIFIYDAVDFAPKGTLSNSSLPWVRGLAFDATGDIIAVGRYHTMWVIDPNGVINASFEGPEFGFPADVDIGPAGTIFVGTQDNVSEFDTSGNLLGTFGSGDYKSPAVLPGNILWGGGGGSGGAPGLLNVFDFCGRIQIGSIDLDGGQQQVQRMILSHETSTVLIADAVENAVFERALDGAFVRRFDASFTRASGVTRGPNGHVYALDVFQRVVFHWAADGTFIDSTDLVGGIGNPSDMLWTGNSPTMSDPDIDGDGVPNRFDICPNVPAPTGVDADGRPLGDFDGDCDVDLSDFTIFIGNYTGPL